jgi:serine/threonine protein kinase
VILWELLTGRQLFPPSEARVPNAALPPPSRYTREVTPTLDQAVLRALAVRPEERFQSGEDMCAALLAEMPREPGGKLQAAKFIGRLFETEIREEAAERRDLVERAAHLDEGMPIGLLESPTVSDEIRDGETTPDLDPDGLIGKVLCDRYFVRRLVGEGAMGRVYEGHHTGIGKRVAIKIAHKVERRKTEVAKRFQREASAPAQIGHPNVADVTDCGTTPGGEFFFVMEFIDGVSLDAVIKRDGQLTIERALAIAVQICRALEAAHRAGIIHRDLKPSNVMLIRSQDQEDMVKVLDFGVAKFLHDTGDGGNLTLTDATVGTPKYMAPEQIRGGGKVDFRSDIYALGAILYTMLAGGRLPIEGPTLDELWQRKLTRDPQPLREYRSDLSSDLEELVLSCLARDQADRPGSAQALKKQLIAHLESCRAVGDSILGMKSPSQTENLGVRRRRRALLGITLGVCVALGSAALGIVLLRSARRQADETTAQRTSPPTVARGPAVPLPTQPAPRFQPEPPLRPAATPAPTSAMAPQGDRLAGKPGLGAPLPPAQPADNPRSKAASPGAPKTSTAPQASSTPDKSPETAGGARPPMAASPGAAGSRSATAAGEPSPRATTAAAEAAITEAETAWSGGHNAEARIWATRAVAAAKRASPELRLRAFIVMGKVELASEKFAEARRWFDSALAIDPQNPVALRGRQRAREAAAKAHAQKP